MIQTPITRGGARSSAMALLVTIGLVISLFAFAVPVSADHESGHESYVIVESSGGTIIPGTTEIGLVGDDDLFVEIALPFDVVFYGTTYSAGDPLVVSSNGNIQFEPDPVLGGATDYIDEDDCLPEAENGGASQYNAAVFGLFADLNDVGDDGGVFTAVGGEAPNRYFVIEWRTEWYESETDVNFEIILHENSPIVTVVYGTIGTPDADEDMHLIGVQETQTGPWTEYTCHATSGEGTIAWTLAPGTVHNYVLGIVQFSATNYDVDEDAGEATITLTRTGTTRGEISVDWFVNGTTSSPPEGIAGEDDYTPVSGTATFADGEDTATFTVPILDDDETEPNETFGMFLGASSGGAVGSPNEATVTIVDDDTAAATTAPTSAPAAPATATPRAIPNTASSDEWTAAAPMVLAMALLAASIVSAGVLAAARRRPSR